MKTGSYHHPNLKRRIIQEAEKIILESGWGSVTLRLLAEKCSVSRNAPYRHFKNKNEILYYFAEKGFKKFTLYLSKSYRMAKSNDPLEVLYIMGLNYIRFSITRKAYYNIMFIEKEACKPDIPESVKIAGKESFEELQKVVKLCHEKNRLISNDILGISYTSWGLTHGLSLLYSTSRYFGNAEEIIQSALMHFINGIKKSEIKWKQQKIKLN